MLNTPYTPASQSHCGLNIAELQQFIVDAEPLFDTMRGGRVLITGATGWFGVWLLDALCTADELLDLGLRITAVSRNPTRFKERFPRFAAESRVAWVEADVRDLHLDAGDATHIIHAAADSSLSADAEAPQLLFDTIVEGTRRVLGCAGKRCKSVLLVSSGAVYGPARPDAAGFSESAGGGPDPAIVNSAYAEGKRAAEQLGALAARRGVPVRIARCFAFVGPHMPFDKHFAIGNFIADAVRSRPIRIKSDGRPVRSYMYMTDLVKALLLVLCRGVIGRAYNVGSDRALTIERVAWSVDSVVGGRGVCIDGAVSDPADRYVPDITRLCGELGFNAGVDLETAIARTAAWYRDHMNLQATS